MFLKKLLLVFIVMQFVPVYGQSRDNTEMQMLVISNVSSKVLVDYLNTHDFEKVKEYHLEDFFLPKDYFYQVNFVKLNDNLGSYNLFSFNGLHGFFREPEITDSTLVALGMHYEVYNYSFNDYVNKLPYSTGIIGVDSLSKDVLFISGYMYLDDIKDKYFELNSNKESKKEYIKLKYFNYMPEIIKVKKRYIIFYSKLTRRKYKVLLKKNFSGKMTEKFSEYGNYPRWIR